jgi:hypothetical protein
MQILQSRPKMGINHPAAPFAAVARRHFAVSSGGSSLTYAEKELDTKNSDLWASLAQIFVRFS